MKNSIKALLCLVAILGCAGTIVGVSLAESPTLSTIAPRQVVLETPMSVDIPQAKAEIVLPEVRIVARANVPRNVPTTAVMKTSTSECESFGPRPLLQGTGMVQSLCD